MAADKDFVLYRGSAPTLRFTMTTNGSVATWTTKLTLRARADGPDPPALSKAGTIADVGSVSTPGVFTVALTKAETLALEARRYAYSFEREDAGFEDVLTIGVGDVRYDIKNAKAS